MWDFAALHLIYDVKLLEPSLIRVASQICKYIQMFAFAAEHLDVLADLAAIG
jgi:hypothetical protein